MDMIGDNHDKIRDRPERPWRTEEARRTWPQAAAATPLRLSELRAESGILGPC